MPGQGISGGYYVQTDSNNESDCGNTCTADAECVGFDYTVNAKSDSCRLFKVDDPRSNPGGDNRMWCTPSGNSLKDALR